MREANSDIEEVLDTIRSQLLDCKSARQTGIASFDVMLAVGSCTAVNTKLQKSKKIGEKREDRFPV